MALNRLESKTKINGLTILGCPTNGEEIPTNVQLMSRLLDTASSHSTVDHPICEECTDALLTEVESQLKFASAKADAFSNLLQEFKENPVRDTRSLEDELAQVCAVATHQCYFS